MVDTLDNLKTRAHGIRVEQGANQNTAERVGGVLEDLVDTSNNKFVQKVAGKDLFSGSYTDLRDKPKFVQNEETAQSEGAYPIGTINIDGTTRTIYGKDTGEGEQGKQRTYFLNIAHDIVPAVPSIENYDDSTNSFVDQEHGYIWTYNNVNPSSGEDTYQIFVWFRGAVPLSIDGPVRIYNSATQGSNGEDSEEIEWIYYRSQVLIDYTSEGGQTVADALAAYRGTEKISGSCDFAGQTWYDHPQGIDPLNKYEYKSYRVSSLDANKRRIWGVTGFKAPVLASAYGDKGEDGDGVEYIFYADMDSSPDWGSEAPNNWTNDAHFQDPEYIRNKETSRWKDNPIDLGAEGFGPGAIEWVSIRKKQDGIWQAYSQPAVWSRLGRDGVVDGYTVDLSNGTMPVGTDFDGFAANYFNNTLIQVYHNGTAITYKDGGGENYFDYTIGSIIRSDGHLAENISANKNGAIVDVSINATGITEFDQVNAYIPITVSLPNGSQRKLEITMFGVAVGEAGKSIDLYTSADVIRTDYEENIITPAKLKIGMKIGEDLLLSSAEAGAGTAEHEGYSFKIYYDEDTTHAASQSGEISLETGHSSITIEAYKGVEPNKFLIDSETIPVVKDGATGYSGQSSFTSTIFVRMNEFPTRPSSDKGSFNLPHPPGVQEQDRWVAGTIGNTTYYWSDGIPEGTETLWATYRVFTNDGNPPQMDDWEVPYLMADTENFDVEFSPNETCPVDPCEVAPNSIGTKQGTDGNGSRAHGSVASADWYDPTLDSNNSHAVWTDMIWKAERFGYIQNETRVWSAWVKVRIKGEKGDSTIATIVDAYSINVLGGPALNYNSDTGVFTPENIKVSLMVHGQAGTYTSDVIPSGMAFEYSQNGSTWKSDISYNSGSGLRWYAGNVSASNFLNVNTPVLYFRLREGQIIKCMYSLTFAGVGATGKAGIDGSGSEWVYIRTNTDAVPVLCDDDDYPDSKGNDYEDDEYLPKVAGNAHIESNNSGDTTNHPYECSDDPKGVSETWPYEWEAKRMKMLNQAGTEREWQKYYDSMPGHKMSLHAKWSKSPTVTTLSLKPVPTSVNFNSNAVGDLTTVVPLACTVMKYTATDSGDSYVPVSLPYNGYYLYYRYIGNSGESVDGVPTNTWQDYVNALSLKGQDLININVRGVEFCLSYTQGQIRDVDYYARDRYTVSITFDGRNGTDGINGQNGQDGATGKMFYSMGEWSPQTLYEVTDKYIPLIYLNSTDWNDATGYGYYYYLDETVATSAYGNADKPNPDVTDGKWKKAEHYGVVITQGLFAEFAKMGKGIFSGDYLFSMNGYVDDREYLGGAKINGFPAYTQFLGDPSTLNGSFEGEYQGNISREVKTIKLAKSCTVTISITGKTSSNTGIFQLYKDNVAVGNAISFNNTEKEAEIEYTAESNGDYVLKYRGTSSSMSITFSVSFVIEGAFEPNWWVDLKTGKMSGAKGNFVVDNNGTVKIKNLSHGVCIDGQETHGYITQDFFNYYDEFSWVNNFVLGNYYTSKQIYKLSNGYVDGLGATGIKSCTYDADIVFTPNKINVSDNRTICLPCAKDFPNKMVEIIDCAYVQPNSSLTIGDIIVSAADDGDFGGGMGYVGDSYEIARLGNRATITGGTKGRFYSIEDSTGWWWLRIE